MQLIFCPRLNKEMKSFRFFNSFPYCVAKKAAINVCCRLEFICFFMAHVVKF